MKYLTGQSVNFLLVSQSNMDPTGPTQTKVIEF